MRTRDPQAKQRQLLDAALSQFADHGQGGARIDAIAAQAACSAGLVYTYFGSKEALFDAVLADIAQRTSDSTPMTTDDLPEYAARLFDSGVADPDVERFVAWYQLERAGTEEMEALVQTMRDKVDVVAAAQEEGRLPTTLGAAELVLAVQTIARMWFTQPDDIAGQVLSAEDVAGRREVVKKLVATLLAT